MDGGKYYEEATEAAEKNREKSRLFQKAGKAYRESDLDDKAEKCYRRASRLLTGNEKANCLMECWTMYMETIGRYLYECNYEWRGETDGSHDSYLQDIKGLLSKAEKTLKGHCVWTVRIGKNLWPGQEKNVKREMPKVGAGLGAGRSSKRCRCKWENKPKNMPLLYARYSRAAGIADYQTDST
jgi:hypothetical protein